MANPQLSVELNAKIDGFTKGMSEAVSASKDTAGAIDVSAKKIDKTITQLEGELYFFNQALKKAFGNPKEIQRLNDEIAKTKKAIDALNNAPEKPLIEVNKASNDAANSVKELGNIIAETSNEVKGISENLTKSGGSAEDVASSTLDLVDAFSSGDGLKAALTLVSTAIALYIAYSKESESVTERNIRLTQEFNQELASHNAQGKQEIALLNSYIAVAKDENVTREGRLQAIAAINDIMPDYLGDIKLDGINSEEAAAKIDKYTKSVFLNAKVKAASSLIEKEYTKQFEAQALAVEDNATGLQKFGAGFGAFSVGIVNAAKDFNNLKFDAVNSSIKAGAQIVDVYDKSIKRLGENTLEKTIKGSNDAIEFFNKILNDSNKELANMGLLFEENEKKQKVDKIAETYKNLAIALKQNNVEFGATFNDKRIADIDAYQNAIKSLIANGVDPASDAIRKLTEEQKRLDEIVRGNPLGNAKQNVKLNNSPSPVAKLIDRKPIGQAVSALDRLRAAYNYTNDDLSKFVNNYGLSLSEIEGKTIEFNTRLSDVINQGIVGSFSDLGSAFGNAIASGTNIAEAAGKSLLSSLGGVLVQLGELAIATGVGIKAVKTALKTLNPVVAIAAGVGLVALGSLFKSKASAIGEGKEVSAPGVKQIPGFASGVNNFGGGLALVGERGAELVNLPTGASVIPNDRTNRILSGNSGKQNVEIFGTVGFDMEQFVIRFRNAEKSLSRSGL